MEIIQYITLENIIKYGIPIISVLLSWMMYENNQKQIKNNEAKGKINEVKKVFPIIIGSIPSAVSLCDVKIYNRSDYPIFDIMVLLGINMSNLSEGNGSGKAQYIRLMLPNETVVLRMKHKGLGMCKFLVAGIFFRDYLGNEWFRDSYGKFQEAKEYQTLLTEKKVIYRPYMESDSIITDKKQT